MNFPKPSLESSTPLAALYHTLKASLDDIDESSVFPIITATSGGVQINILLDNCNEKTLVTKHVVRRLKVKTFTGNPASILGLGDTATPSGDLYAPFPFHLKTRNSTLLAWL